MQQKFLINSLICAILFLTGFSTAFAQITTVKNYKDSIGNNTEITYADLLKTIFPDVIVSENSKAVAQTSVPLNHLFGDYKAKVFEEEIKINEIKNLNAKLASKNQILLLVSVKSENEDSISAGEMSVLALFETKPAVKLLDAADVQTDRFTEIWEKQTQISISSKEIAFVLVNSHNNSTQGYSSISLITVINDKLKSVFDFPTLLSSNECGNAFTETPKISVLKTARKNAYFNVSVEVKFVKESGGVDCEKQTKGYTRYYRSVLVWNAAKREYNAGGSRLTELGKFNEKNF